jgi:Family of unknown function (DUF6492)
MNRIGRIFARAPGKLRRLLAARRLSRRYSREDPGSPPSARPLEVVIPVVAKDLPTLPLCVASIRRFVRHPIVRIRLVTRPDDAMRAAAAALDTPLIDENELLSPEARALEYRVNGTDRSGWIRQQLVKLAGDSIAVQADRFLVVDSDTAFTRDIVFCRDNVDILFCSDEYHRPYYDAYRRLTGITDRYPLSFVSHHMVFNCQHLRELRQLIERHTGKRWDLAYLASLDPQVTSCIAEYEMYGNFCAAKHPREVSMRYWHNRAVSGTTIPSLDEVVKAYGRRYFTVSFHSYLRSPAA